MERVNLNSDPLIIRMTDMGVFPLLELRVGRNEGSPLMNIISKSDDTI